MKTFRLPQFLFLFALLITLSCNSDRNLEHVAISPEDEQTLTYLKEVESRKQFIENLIEIVRTGGKIKTGGD